MVRTKRNLFVITDAGRDHDDELALSLLAGLHKSGHCEIMGAIANLHPTQTRAQLVKGTLQAMGLSIPVAMGHPGEPNNPPKPYEFDVSYLSSPDAVEQDGQALLKKTFQTAQQNRTKITLLLISGMMDANQFLNDHPLLFQSAIDQVVLMGGVKIDEKGNLVQENGYVLPNQAYNNCVDRHLNSNPAKNPIGPSAVKLYRALQDLNIPTTILTRFTAYKAAVAPAYYEQLADTKHPIALRLLKDQKAFIDHFWADIMTGKAAPRFTRSWFISVYCDNDPEALAILRDRRDSPWPFVRNCNLYDPLAALVASGYEALFHPIIPNQSKGSVKIIGLNPQKHGILDQEKLHQLLNELPVLGFLG